ncbi:MAG: hypothetical protein J6A63_06405 [Clostridia bacterium]|nr:hypothetical protein [Clostridia bacterium]
MKLKKVLCAISLALCATTCATAAATVFAETAPPVKATALAPSDLWLETKGITVQSNVEMPDYCKSGLLQTGYAVTDVKPITEKDLQDWEKNGVKVTTETESELLYFKNVIDIDGFTSEDHLIDIMPLTSIRATSRDMAGLRIWLYDADDESNWIRINLNAVNITSTTGTYVSVTTSTGFTGGYRWGNQADLELNKKYGQCETSVGGFYNADYPQTKRNEETGKYEPIHALDSLICRPFSIRYDVAKNSVYMRATRNDNLTHILNLNDEPLMGYGKTWNGFTNNRIRLAVQAQRIENSPASYMLLNVANEGMNGTQVEDHSAPSYLEHVPNGGVPKAIVGKPYSAFDIDFYDFYDGELDYTVKVKAPGENNFTTINGTFTPSKEGEYTLRLEATDAAGNKTPVDYVVKAVPQVDMPVLSMQFDGDIADCNVGATVQLPTAIATGGSGPVAITKRIVRAADHTVIPVQGNTFTALYAGQYSVEYTARDYLGMTLQKELSFTVTGAKTPAFETELQMYKKFVSGIKVELPKPNAFDYETLPGQKLNAVTKITAYSTKDDYTEEVENFVFTPDHEKFGDKVKLVYLVTCAAYPQAEYAQKREFEVDIYEPSYIWEYFTYDTEKITVGYNTKEEGQLEQPDQYMSLTMQSDELATFISPLRAATFEFEFATVTPDAFDGIRLVLTDSFDSTQTVELIVKQKDNVQSYVYYNGKESVMNGGLGNSAYPLVLKFQNGNLCDYAGAVVFDMQDVTFTSGKIWASAGLSGVNGEAELKIRKFGSQVIRASYKNNVVESFTDRLKPEIEVLGRVKAEPEFGERVTIPTAKAYDLCSPYMEVFFTLTSPSGKKLFNNQPVAEDVSFIAEEYGTYRLQYTTVDAANRKTNLPFNIVISDTTTPTIDYIGKTEIACKAGDTLYFPNVKAYDAIDEEPTLMVFVCTTDGNLINVTDTLQYTFTKKGKYVLRYYAYDANYNVAIQDVTVTVG